jgi:hypothetical protein
LLTAAAIAIVGAAHLAGGAPRRGGGVHEFDVDAVLPGDVAVILNALRALRG